MTQVLSWHPKQVGVHVTHFSHPMLCIFLVFVFFKQAWSIVKLFKSIEWCATQMFYLPYAGLTPRQRPMSPSQAALAKGTMPFAFDGFRTWSFHTVWTCLTVGQTTASSSIIIHHQICWTNDCFRTASTPSKYWLFGMKKWNDIFTYIHILFNYI